MLVLLKASSGCNLHCLYCSGSCGDGPRLDLTEKDCSLLVKELPAILKEGEAVTFLWHGGEPTLLEAKDFVKMQTVLNELRSAGHEIHYQMQTNAYHLDEEWLDTLACFKVHVGVSIDGPQPLHDVFRKTHEGKGSYDQVMANIDLLREKFISVALLCTIHSQHLGQEDIFLDWLQELNLPTRLNPLLCQGRSTQALSQQDYFSFLRSVFIRLLASQSALPVEPLEWMFKSILWDIPPRECSYNGSCGHSIFAFGPGADIGLCNRSAINFGNLNRMALVDLYKSSQWEAIRLRQTRLLTACGKCTIWKYCHGGCQAISDIPAPEACEARKKFFNWLGHEGLSLYREALVRRRLQLQKNLQELRTIRSALSPKMD